MPTATKADAGAAGEVKSVSFRIVERKLTLDAQWTIVSYGNRCFSQLTLLFVAATLMVARGFSASPNLARLG
jgi:hypothetical protein